MPVQVFDGHNDALSRLWCAGGDPVAAFAGTGGHVNTPGCKAGGMGGGFFALYSPLRRESYDFTDFKGGAMPLPEPVTQDAALVPVMAQIGIAKRLQAAGLIDWCVTAGQIEAAMGQGRLAGLLHLEGAECIDPELLVLDALHALGLRSLGPVWSRPTIWGEGVPFGFGQDGDTGPGLTAAGKRLVVRCAELGMVVDLSHLTVKGFWDVAETGLPLVATHSNAWDLCRTTRNLTRDQLQAIGQTGGMMGLNFATVFLSARGWETGQATIGDCLDQIEALIAGAGEDHVGLGSDFDGAPMPEGLGSAAALPALTAALNDRFGADLTARICSGNWLAFLRRVLGD